MNATTLREMLNKSGDDRAARKVVRHTADFEVLDDALARLDGEAGEVMDGK